MIKYILSSKVGVNNGEGPPVPIPNTEVKLIRAEDTWRATAWENKSMPTLIFLSWVKLFSWIKILYWAYALLHAPHIPP